MAEKLGSRLKELRSSKRLSLQDVSRLSGVSRSMLSKIELGKSSPTATTLGKIAEGLGVSISQLMAGPMRHDVIVTRHDQHPVFRVPRSGFERKSLSPTSETGGVDLALNILPPGQSSGVFPQHRPGVEETLFVASGRLVLWLGDTAYQLDEGDSIYYRAQVAHRFDNPSATREARFFIVINNSGATETPLQR